MMMYILYFFIAIIAILITRYTVPFILSATKIPHHLVTTVNLFLNIAVLLSTFSTLFFLLHVLGVASTIDKISEEQHETTIHQLKSVDEKKSRISKEEDQLAKEKERERIEQERLRALEAEKERYRIELEKQRRLTEEKERERIEQERLRELEAEKERHHVELEKQRRLAEEKERERIEQERLRELEAEKKSPCEKIKDSLDKRLLSYAIKKARNEMTIVQNRQGVLCYIIPSGIKRGCIEYQIQKEGSSDLCFYKECTER